MNWLSFSIKAHLQNSPRITYKDNFVSYRPKGLTQSQPNNVNQTTLSFSLLVFPNLQNKNHFIKLFLKDNCFKIVHSNPKIHILPQCYDIAEENGEKNHLYYYWSHRTLLLFFFLAITRVFFMSKKKENVFQ